jgi:hypothetical protein
MCQRQESNIDVTGRRGWETHAGRWRVSCNGLVDEWPVYIGKPRPTARRLFFRQRNIGHTIEAAGERQHLRSRVCQPEPPIFLLLRRSGAFACRPNCFHACCRFKLPTPHVRLKRIGPVYPRSGADDRPYPPVLCCPFTATRPRMATAELGHFRPQGVRNSCGDGSAQPPYFEQRS